MTQQKPVEKQTCGQCQYYDQRKGDMFCKNMDNMLSAHGEIRILDNTPACPKFEIRMPENMNAAFLLLAENHTEDLTIKSVIKQIKFHRTQLTGALQQCDGMITNLEVMNDLEDISVFGDIMLYSFSCFSELQTHYTVISTLFELLRERLEQLGEDISFL